MNIYINILFEFLLISTSILLLFKLRNKLGLAPLYIFLGSVQYLQALSGTIISFKLFDDVTIYPVSVVLFSSLLFAVLLIYIKEGVASARTLIIGIIISNFLLAALFGITYEQEYATQNINEIESSSVFLINYKYFILGTIILLLDFIFLVIIYQFLISRINKSYFFLVLFISLFTVLFFDAFVFNITIIYGSSDFKISLIGHIIGKSFSALIFSIILYVYLKYIDDEKSNASFIANQNRDVFSILRYRKRYLDLKVEKKRVENKLESQIETALKHISDGFVSLDTNWCYTYVNIKAGEFLGRTPKSLIGKHIWTEFPDGVGLPFYNAYHKAVETQETQYFEDYYEPFDKWYENRIYPSPDGLTIYFTDISNQKKAEMALKENEKYLDNIINNIGDPVFVKDDKGQFLLVNDSCCSILNLSRAEIIGKTLAEDIPQEEMEIFFKIDKQVIETGIENVNEESLTVRDKKTRRISTKKTRFIDSNGNKFLIGTIRDITEQKKAEKEILALGNRNTLIIETLLDGFILADSTGKILDINPSYINMIGYTQDELLSMNINQLEVALNKTEIEERIKEMISKGFARFNSNHKKKNGELIDLDVNTFTMQVNEQFVVAAFVKDITESKKTAKELKKYRNQLEDLVKERTEEVDSKNDQLQRMNKLFVGRELKMKELKKIIKKLQSKNDD